MELCHGSPRTLACDYHSSPSRQTAARLGAAPPPGGKEELPEAAAAPPALSPPHLPLSPRDPQNSVRSARVPETVELPSGTLGSPCEVSVQRAGQAGHVQGLAVPVTPAAAGGSRSPALGLGGGSGHVVGRGLVTSGGRA